MQKIFSLSNYRMGKWIVCTDVLVKKKSGENIRGIRYPGHLKGVYVTKSTVSVPATYTIDLGK